MTEIISVHDKSALKKALAALRKDGIIVYPTETSYGLGCDATNPATVKKLLKIKKEPRGRPCSVIISSIGMAKEYAKFGKTALVLIKKFMPGPLTLVCEKTNKTPNVLSKKTIAFRISGNKFANSLAERFGKPITSTSANIHGYGSIYDIGKIKKVFLGKVDLIIDAGSLPRRRPSTIFDLEAKKILRKGPISFCQIQSELLADACPLAVAKRRICLRRVSALEP
ncbi:MAG: threonylcarbamoyl-AMP synthase [Candidatus Aenigmarchaeota archaeon]|nr:threonylcarbamoyl-AMP synthase [Candidatus Aenigmarchaeota archaeon]